MTVTVINDGNITILKEHIRRLAGCILEREKERAELKEDMKELRLQLSYVMPKNLVNKAIKVWFYKGCVKKDDVDEYQQVCDLLHLPYTCDIYQPSDTDFSDTEKEVRSKATPILQRYSTLEQDYAELSDDIKDYYAEAKGLGISVPLLKKLVDFVLHPDKLLNYREDTPLLEVYTEVIPEIK